MPTSKSQYVANAVAALESAIATMKSAAAAADADPNQQSALCDAIDAYQAELQAALAASEALEAHVGCGQ